MKFIFTFLFIIILYIGLIAQNTGYFVFKDSIKPIIESDYSKAKTLIKKYEYDIDPSELILILDDVLSKGDIMFFKDRAIFLMKNYGWNYNYLDTLEHKLERSSLLREIKRCNLEEWTYINSQLHYPIWIQNHSESLRYLDQVHSCLYSDQLFRKLLPSAKDSVELMIIYDLINKVDFSNLETIVELSENNSGILLNNFDNGVGIYYNILLILWHNLASESNFEKAWELILPYVEKAYFQKKINYSIFKTYDTWLQRHTGFQYYGTLNDSIKIRDIETFPDRQKKYFLNDINNY